MTMRSQWLAISSNRHSSAAMTLPQSCLESAMPIVSALRSV